MLFATHPNAVSSNTLAQEGVGHVAGEENTKQLGASVGPPENVNNRALDSHDRTFSVEEVWQGPAGEDEMR